MNGFPGILGPDGRPVTADRVRLEKSQRFNPLANWTPDVLVRQLTGFARGEIKDLAWVMDWLESHDDMIATVAPKAKAAVSREGYEVRIKPEIEPEDRQLAEDQRGILQQFYDSLEVGHAIDGDLRGGMRLLAHQVMDGYGKGWSAHHLVWRPTAAGLRAEAIFVPLWLWEATEGKLRFLSHHSAIRGVDRDELGGPTAWMISRGRGVMLACAVASMFKRIPLQDWLTYCDRHGMPAFLGKTSSTKGQPGWNDLYLAVTSIGSEFGAVINTGDAIEVLDLTTKGELPYEKLIDRMDRATVMLWRGGDLATISRGDGVGSNPQMEETDDLDADNAMWVGETIDRQLSRVVLDWHFGEGTPQLASLCLKTKTRDNLELDLKVAEGMQRLGVRLSKSWLLAKFGVQEVDPDDPEDALEASSVPENRNRQDAKSAKSGTDEAGDESGDDTPGDDDAGGDAGAPEGINEALADGLAEALGVRASLLGPVAPLLAELEARADDQALTDDDFLRLAERLAEELPEFIPADEVEAFAGVLEEALAGAMVAGVRETVKSQDP